MNSQTPNTDWNRPTNPMPHYGPGPHRATFGAGDLFDILLRRKRIIVITALVAALAAAFYAFGRERNYLATSRILINPRGLQLVDRDVTARTETNDGGIAIVESQMRVITSNNVLSRVVDKEVLYEDREFVGPGKGPVAFVMGIVGSLAGGGRSASPDVKALYNLQEAVSTKRPKRSYIIELAVKTKDADKSARLANAIADIYITSEADARSGLAGRASSMLTGRLNELRAQLNAAEEAVERYKVENNILSTSGSLINEQELTQANQLLVAASGKTAEALSKYEQVRSIGSSGDVSQVLPEAAKSNTITRLRERYAIARQRQQSLSAQLLPNHPRMLAAKAELDSARAQVNAELKRIADVAKTEYERAVANEKNIKTQITRLKSGTYKTNDAMVRLRELQRDADSKRAIYESFLVRARELGEQQQVDTTAARVVSRAVAPLDPAGPGSLLIVALALVAGSGLGAILAFGREALDGRSNAPGGAPVAMPAPMPQYPPVETTPMPAASNDFRQAPAANNDIGQMSVANNDVRQAPAASNDIRQAPAASAGPGETTVSRRSVGNVTNLPVLATVPIDPNRSPDNGLPVFVAEMPESPAARSIDDLLHNLRPSGANGAVRTVLVTSPGLNHGKTTVSLNLAVAAAKKGEKVLLIDGDFARRSLSAARVGDPSIGLSNVLAGAANLEDALIMDSSRLVMVLPAGHKGDASWSFAATADKLRRSVMARLPDVSLIVIDGPVTSRSGGLAPYSDCADAICLVVREGEADESTLRRSAASVSGRAGSYSGSVVVLDSAAA